MALTYFLAAQLGLSLLAKPSDVAVFWPASGIAAGILVAVGRRVGVALVVGVVVGTIAANLMSDRSLSTSILKGFCNAGEAVLLIWLLDRWFGRPFSFCDLRRVGAFFTAVGIAVSISAVGGAATITTLQTAAPFWDVWRTFFLSDAVGILVVAPLLIELGQATSQRRSRAELIEGAGTVVLIALASIYAVTFPTGTWLSFEPDAIAFVVLLWLTARNQQPFAIAGAFAVSIAVIGAATYGTGHFGDVTLPITERVQGAQVVATMVTAFTLVLSALFTERRRNEAELKQSNNRLQLALDCAELGIWSLQLNTGRFENDVRDRCIHGHGQEAPPKTLAEMRRQVHPDDLAKLDATFRELRHAGGSCRTEYRLARRTDQEDAVRERWVTLEGTIVHRADGRPEQFLGVTRDITERKHAENALRTSEERLRRVSDNADVGLIRCSCDWIYLSANPAYAKITGKPVDQIVGWPMAEVMGAEAVETIRPYVERVLGGEHVIYEAEVPYAGAGTRYMHVSYTPDTDTAGQIVGWVACVTDITERKHAEDALHQREVELGEAQRLAHIGSWFWEAETDALVASDELLRIYGLDPATQRALSLRDQRGRWHPVADWERLKAAIQRTMQTGLGYELELRAFQNEAPIWITARGAAVRNSKGQIIALRGTVQDITERKQAELALADRNLQLRLAEMAGLIGSYAYDTSTEIGQISSGYAAIHGLPEGTTEITRGEWLARVHSADINRLQLCRSEALRERRQEYKVDYRIIRHDGEVRWIESRVFIVFGSDATGHRLTGVNIDVTERKRGEQALVERNILLALAGRAARVGTFAYDTNDTEMMQISADYAAIYGFPKGTAEIARSEWLASVHPEDVERARLARSEAFHERWSEYSAEYRIIRPGGEIRWVEIRCFITYDGDGHPKRVVGVSTDVTDRKQAELWLAERNSQLDLAGQIARIGTFTYDHGTQKLQISPGFATIYGMPENMLEISHEDWRTMVHPDDLPRLDTVARHALTRREKELVLEFRILRHGEVRWIESRMLISYEDTGKPTRRIGAQIDVTERRRAEDHKGLLVAELDHRVKNTLATVSAVVSQTRQGRRSVADFAAALEGRLRSMAATHELLSARRWSGLSLANVVSHELAPYANRNNTEIKGPDVALRPEAGQAMAMVIHELATNAAKYGALSTRKGRVSIWWDRRLNGRPRSDLVLEWQEIGGPPVSAPGNSGYGTSTIRDLIPYEFHGTVDLVFAPEGVRCRLKLPADWLSDAADAYDPGSGVMAGVAAK
jgi:PAS domain S-box-containing protein